MKKAIVSLLLFLGQMWFKFFTGVLATVAKMRRFDAISLMARVGAYLEETTAIIWSAASI